MPIEIVDSPEPLSEESLQRRGPDAEPLLVESNASRVLRQELERYCEGKINGRSFLIAGHRGAGKTTLVAKAFFDVKRASDAGASMLRPLFIPLHGPSLFPDPAAQVPETANAAGDAGSGADQKKARPERKSDAQIALEQITLGLHRAVSREFAAQFHARAQQLAYLLRTPNQARQALSNLRSSQSAPSDPVQAADARLNAALPDDAELDALIESLPSERELFELAGQFEAELYEGPSPERLRDYWERMHALSGGVLFPGGFAPLVSGVSGFPTPPTPPGLFPNLIEVHAQGVRELVALSGVLEAYRRISGDYKRTEGQKDTQQNTSERTTGFNAAAKELAAPVVSLLTGGLATTGLALSGTTPIATALGGIVTALGASLIFKVNTTRKYERSQSREYQFIYDLSVATLDRILPILIERLREAGLAPVFVVDELDKVDELSKRIISMVHHLKKLVAENAFFCFLTNRSYFEEMLAQGSGRAYPVEYTYYTHRLFVVFAPEDFERYLLRRLPNPPLPSLQSPAVQSAVEVAPETAETTACAILRWALRHRSQLHVVDLQREIAALRDDEGRVRTAPEDIVSARRNIIDVTFQVGIESTLGQRDVIQVMQYRPEFRRLLHDAMYYLSRHWLAGAEEVDLSPAGRDDFLAYLENRTGRDEERRLATDNASNDSRPSVTENDLDFLYDQVRILADFLSDRPSVEVVVGNVSGTTRDWRSERLAAWSDHRKRRGLPDLEPDVLDALLVGERSSLLVRDSEHPLVYQFRHRVAGSAAQPSDVAPRKRTKVRLPTAGVTVKTAPAKAEVEPPPAPAVQEKPVAAPPAAAAAPTMQSTAWEPKARFIEQFANALHAVTLAGDSPGKQGSTRRPGTVSAVTLDTLATRFRIITSSPTASVVLQAIANLRDAASRGSMHAGYADDVFAVEQFHQILERNGEQIARALALGAAVGRTCPESTPDARIAAGLAVIARAMQFANKREEDVGRSLENVSAMIRTEYGGSFEAPLSRLAEDWPSVDAFSQSTREALEIIAGLAPPAPDSDVERAWESMQDRLNHWVQNNEVLDPDVSELLAAAARRGPTELLEFDPREMTLAQWTRTLLLTRRKVFYPAAPTGTDLSWLTFYAWHALGFRSPGDTYTQKLADWAGVGVEFSTAGATGHWPFQLQRAYKAIQDGYLLHTSETPVSTLIMIRRTKSPMTAAWRPVPDAAILLLMSDELPAFTQTSVGPPIELPITTERLCAIEMEPELATHLYNFQLPAIKSLFQGGWLIYVYPADRGREMKMPNVVAPPDAQAVIDAGIQGRTLIPDAPAV